LPCDIYLFIICTSCMIRLIVCYFNTKLPLAIRGSPAPKKRGKRLSAHTCSRATPPRTAHHLVPPKYCCCLPFRFPVVVTSVIRLPLSRLMFLFWSLWVAFSLPILYIYIYIFPFLIRQKKENMIACEFVLGPCFVLFYLTGGNL